MRLRYYETTRETISIEQVKVKSCHDTHSFRRLGSLICSLPNASSSANSFPSAISEVGVSRSCPLLLVPPLVVCRLSRFLHSSSNRLWSGVLWSLWCDSSLDRLFSRLDDLSSSESTERAHFGLSSIEIAFKAPLLHDD